MGYFVQRYEIDEKTKHFISSYFFKTNAMGGNITESLKATAKSDLTPVSYQFTNQTGDTTKTIDMTFKNNLMGGTITNNGKKEKVSLKVDKKTFLSTFLVYWLALPDKGGIKKGMNQSYSAIAEEDGKIEKGKVTVTEEDTMMGQHVFKMINNFKDTSWINMVTPDGISLSTKSPVQGIRTEISSRAEATATFMMNEKTLTAVFGMVPNDNYYKKLSLDIKIETVKEPKGLPTQQPKPQMIPDPKENSK